LVVPAHVMDVIEEELGKLSFLDPHSSEFKYNALCCVAISFISNSKSSQSGLVGAVPKCKCL